MDHTKCKQLADVWLDPNTLLKSLKICQLTSVGFTAGSKLATTLSSKQILSTFTFQAYS